MGAHRAGGAALSPALKAREVFGNIEHLYDVEHTDGVHIGARHSELVTPPVETGTMARQLTLIETPSTWRLDERTRETGRRGIASARAVLAEHRPEAGGQRSDAA